MILIKEVLFFYVLCFMFLYSLNSLFLSLSSTLSSESWLLSFMPQVFPNLWRAHKGTWTGTADLDCPQQEWAEKWLRLSWGFVPKQPQSSTERPSLCICTEAAQALPWLGTFLCASGQCLANCPGSSVHEVGWRWGVFTILYSDLQTVLCFQFHSSLLPQLLILGPSLHSTGGSNLFLCCSPPNCSS